MSSSFKHSLARWADHAVLIHNECLCIDLLPFSPQRFELGYKFCHLLGEFVLSVVYISEILLVESNSVSCLRRSALASLMSFVCACLNLKLLACLRVLWVLIPEASVADLWPEFQVPLICQVCLNSISLSFCSRMAISSSICFQLLRSGVLRLISSIRAGMVSNSSLIFSCSLISSRLYHSTV